MKRFKPLYFIGSLLVAVLVLLGSIAFSASAGNLDLLSEESRKAFLQQLLDSFDWNNFPWDSFPFEDYADFPWGDLPWDDLPADFDWDNIPWDNLPSDFDWSKVPWKDAPADFDWDKIPWDDLPSDFPWQDLPWDNMPENFDWGNIPWDNLPPDFPWDQMPWDDLPPDFPWDRMPWDSLPEDFPWQELPWDRMGEDFPWQELPWEKIPPEMLPFLGIPWLLVPPDAVPEDIFPEGFFPWDHEHQVNPLVPWTVEKTPTCGEKGLESNTCLICKQRVTRDIPATGKHDYDDDWYCSLCHRRRLLCASGSAKAAYGDVSAVESPSAEIVWRYTSSAAEGLDVRFTDFASLSFVGTKANTFTVTVLDGEGKDVTRDFIVERLCGELELTQREIVLKTESMEKPYDGEPLTWERWSAEGLAPGDEIVDVVFGEGQTDYGWRSNEIIDFRIVNGRGEDVTMNYAVRMEFGRLTVTP